MPLELKDVDYVKDFQELIECEWISYENPQQSFFRLFCPIIGAGPTAREESLKECTSRQLQWHQSDPTSYWHKVIDTESGKIVGAALWKICPTNPFEHEDDHSEVSWYPEGGQRDFVAAALQRFDAPRERLAPKPQLYLNIIYTHPEFRRQGVADMIMKWGIEKAKEMGVEIWLDATVYGVPLYKKHGFAVVNENNLVPEPIDEPDEEWTKIATSLGPMTMWQMVRKVDEQ
ncbi:hypothetical protein BCIN_14g03700 [Botrytis cinerea B05.10]|uniref:N-acetyltransferase domain-containing protein n=1 Tax=Botryotinia fuckeliana (strain B05.10) TaxID=332648 RepID=A0A384K313_BOTFB|nr:hypothetical protein BCIN_14g03700 [Botrytis cinerea B05.10]ATZ57210.1 hypothetical protein BCIN_14g03700 [Botrytis cinerea B05.10]